jgi:HK97 family phage major capsid protein
MPEEKKEENQEKTALEKLTDTVTSGIEGIKDSVSAVKEEVKTLATRVDTLEEKKPEDPPAEPSKKRVHANPDEAAQPGLKNAPTPITGERGESRGYSFLRMARAIMERDWSFAKPEKEVSEKLREIGYQTDGGALVPLDAAFLCRAPGHEALKSLGLDEMVKAPVANLTIDDIRSMAKTLNRDFGQMTKALGVDTDPGGGYLRGPEFATEIIELLRNAAAVERAGARSIPMPPSGQLSFAKQTGGATAYWVGESASITESALTFGNLNLLAKKLGIYVILSNDLIRYSNPAAEMIVRQDFAQVAALAEDLAFLENAGSNFAPKGIIAYDGITTHLATTIGANGNTFEADDVNEMVGKCEDVNGIFQSWIMRSLMYAALSNRRADAVTAADSAGPFLFDTGRALGQGMGTMLAGYPVIKSAQVSNTRAKGAGTALTYILGGDFREVLIGRVGAMEVAASDQTGTTFQKDQTALRGILRTDMGLRQEAVIIFCDTLLVA